MAAGSHQEIETKILSLDFREKQGRLVLSDLSSKERLTRTLKTLGIFWLIAVLFVPLPAIHFVAVPAFFVLGIVFAVKTWFATRVVRSGEGACPICEEKLKFGQMEYKPEIKITCPGCRNQLKMKVAPTT